MFNDLILSFNILLIHVTNILFKDILHKFDRASCHFAILNNKIKC